MGSSPPDEEFHLIPGQPTDGALLAAAARAGNDGAYAALPTAELLVFPSLSGARLRAVQCAVTDPVSFALAAGRTHADFIDVPGWSAPDSAHRAVAEHRAWLHRQEPGGVAAETVGRLFTAARAALFLESLEAGEPSLPLTVASTATTLRGRAGWSDHLVSAAYESYREGRSGEKLPAGETATRLREAVMTLPAFAHAS